MFTLAWIYVLNKTNRIFVANMDLNPYTMLVFALVPPSQLFWPWYHPVCPKQLNSRWRMLWLNTWGFHLVTDSSLPHCLFKQWQLYFTVEWFSTCKNITAHARQTFSFGSRNCAPTVLLVLVANSSKLHKVLYCKCNCNIKSAGWLRDSICALIVAD